jgi:lysyl-tRNA synthetase class 2
MYLRIAPELYLKRLVVGGFERVFEINRNFRNEGISVRHNPEFTMMELYMAYADYKDLIELTESLFRTLAQDILGNTEVPYGDQVFDFGKPFEKLTMREAIKKYRPETEMADLDNFDSAKAIAESIGIKVEKSWGLGRIVTEIFEEVAEAHLIQPTFITEYPAEVSPLARRNDVNPEITDRFEFFIGGREIGNGFSELNDAEDQAQRFQDQVESRRRRRSDVLRRRLRDRAGTRPAADRWSGYRYRPYGDAVHQQPHHPRRDPVPGDASAEIIALAQYKNLAGFLCLMRAEA